MPRKLDLTARQVTALCKGAARAGYVPIVQIGDVTIRLVPESAAADISAQVPGRKRLMGYFPPIASEPEDTEFR